MKNRATLKFKNFTARPRYFRVRLRLARAGAALCYARPAEAACLERSSAVAKPSGVGKNFKILNFKSRNTTAGTDFDADRNIRLGAGHDINFRPDRAVNFKISNANLKANLARPKAGFR
ncbi:hypothetical protein [uncultured Campylobacter sp.]|uniref:hypothetical protein n=1 Tax=uncultured Campylobacter sp. TaxID=218934 RepID=UPI0026101400|nr:hypothetical protein [uncultured Campylobacter sp.]